MGDSTEMEILLRESLSFPRRLRFLHFPALSKNSIIVLSFGEIDIRVHVARQAKIKSVEPIGLVEGLVDDALNLISFIQSSIGCKIIFLAVPPPVADFNDPKYPTVGDLGERIAWVNLFNSFLEAQLLDRPDLRARVMNVNKLFSNLDGTMRSEYSDGTVHFGENVVLTSLSQLETYKEVDF